MDRDRDEQVSIRTATVDDAAALMRIYNYYVRETIVTFEEAPVSETDMSARVEEVLNASFPWVVAVRGPEVLGYAYGANWKRRVGYRFSAEVTVYLEHERGGRGVGSRLYTRLLSDLRDRGVHVAIGGIALPNDVSTRLHEKLGFRKVAHFHEVGFKFDRWIDVGYWEKVLRTGDGEP
ncbi:MAG: N-acetyltransferase family protein [Acidobacteriota bacterium]